MTSTFAAVDLGASSGRVMIARVGPDRLDLSEVHRFPNRPVRTAGTLQWDVLGLYAGVLDGLRAAGRDGEIDGIGIDSWAVDVGLLDADGALLGNPVHYRDTRHETAVPAVHAAVPPEELYRVSGLQHLPSTPSSGWPRPGGRRSSPRPGRHCWSPTCWRTGSPAGSAPRSPTPPPPGCSTPPPGSGPGSWSTGSASTGACSRRCGSPASDWAS